MSTTTTHLLPRSHSDPTTWKSLIEKSKSLRLQSLQTSPEAFSSTYAQEIAFANQVWEDRLRNPLAFTFIAMKHALPGSSEDRTLIEGEWIGNIVLFGPTKDVKGCAKQDDGIPLFDIFAFFVAPQERGSGVGCKLTEAAIEHMQTLATERGYGEVVMRAKVRKGNERVVAFYERMGFEAVEGQDEEGIAISMIRRGIQGHKAGATH